MKKVKRFSLLALALVMCLGTVGGTTAFAAEIPEEGNVVTGEVLSQEVLPNGVVATTVEFEIANPSEDATLALPSEASVTPRMWAETDAFSFESGDHYGNWRTFYDGYYLAFEVIATAGSSWYTKDQVVTATLIDRLGNELGTATGHTVNKELDQKADWISFTSGIEYKWHYESDDVSSFRPVTVVMRYYTWS